VLRFFVLLGLGGAFLCAAAGVGAFWYYGRDLPDISRVEDYDPPQITRVTAADGRVLGEFGEQRRRVVSVDEIPPLLLNAFVAAEDASFYEHDGVDVVGIGRALVINLLNFKVSQGASTITQQVVKNLVLTSERKWSRKIKEAILSYRLEERLSKREILAIYVNEIPFGHGVYGVAEAARRYFDKPLSALTVGEIAYLAGMVQTPERYTLDRHPEAARQRQEYVLDRLLELGYIDQATFNAAKKAPLVAHPPESAGNLARYAVDMARTELEKRVGKADVAHGGFRISLTLDTELQEELRLALRDNLIDFDRRHGYRPLPIVPETERNRWDERVTALTRRLTLKEKTPPVLAFDAEQPAPDDEDGEDAPAQKNTKVTGPFWETMIRRVRPGNLYFARVRSVEKNGDLHVTLGAREGLIPAADLVWAKASKPAKSAKGKAKSEPASDAFKPGQAVVVQAGADIENTDSKIPVPLRLAQVPEAQSAMIVLDPESGAIRAIEGGFSYLLSPYNRAIQAKRQPGSAFKPFVYLAALRSKRFTAASLLVDEAVEYPGPEGKTWSPRNFDRKYRGSIRLREALAQSVNTITVKLLNDTGLRPVIDLARSLGIRSDLAPNLTLALGSSELSLFELTAAYAAFSARGVYHEPYLVEKVISPDNRVLWIHEAAPKKALAEEEAALMVSLLRSVVDEGTSQQAKTLGRPVAGKTGTTNEQRDAWFVGFSPRLACGVWVGYDDRHPLGRGETGARAALPAWIAFMEAAHRDMPTEAFPSAPELLHTWIDPETGAFLPGDDPKAVEELFLPGSIPEESAAATNGDTEAETNDGDREREVAP